MGVVWKAGDVIAGLIGPDLIGEEERVQMVQHSCPDAPVQPDARSIGSRLGLYCSFNRAKLHQ